MSLINEALKRTRDASYTSSVVPAAAPGYRVQSGVESSGSKGTLLITVLVAVVAIGGIVGLASRLSHRVAGLRDGFGSSTEATPAAPEAKQPELLTGPSPTPVQPTKVQAPPAEPPQSTTTGDSKAGEDQLVARVVEKIKADQAAAAPAAPETPKYVLQGITFDKDGGEAMINGLSAREGENIGDARVVAIDRRAVKLDCDGHEVVLRLP